MNIEDSDSLLYDDDILDENDPAENTNNSELTVIQNRVREMESEVEKLQQIEAEVVRKINQTPTGLAIPLSEEDRLEADSRSIFLGNIDYGATAEELEEHFRGCGYINRASILSDKFNGHPKGFAYMEFSDKDSVTVAMTLNGSLFRGREIKVEPKRTNHPGISTTNRGGFRGQSRGQSRGRGRGIPGWNRSGFGRASRGRGRISAYRPFRGRSRDFTKWYAPY